jgi:hypothetical protein
VVINLINQHLNARSCNCIFVGPWGKGLNMRDARIIFLTKMVIPTGCLKWPFNVAKFKVCAQSVKTMTKNKILILWKAIRKPFVT